MKLLPKLRTEARPRSDDALGHGMDAVIMMVLFLAAGYGLDQAAGTLPVFMIVTTILGAVGLFARFYYRYSARMDEHDSDRRAKLAGTVRARPDAAVHVDRSPRGGVAAVPVVERAGDERTDGSGS